MSDKRPTSDKRLIIDPAGARRRDRERSSSDVTAHEHAPKRAVGAALARLIKGVAVGLALAAGVSAGPRPVAAADAPTEFISIVGTDVLQEMRSTASMDQKEAYFRQMLREDADLDGISRFVLGPYWRIASAEQRQEFRNLYEDYIIRADGPKLAQYSGGTFRVTGSRTDPAGVMVSSQIISPQDAPIRLDWQLGISGGRYKIEDLAIDGISVALTRRSEVAAMMARSGGQVGTLLATMRQED
jgi:phospholipid transport system substrate-binding protein